MLGFSAAVASLSPVSTDVVNLAAVLATPRVLRAVTALPLFVRITNTISPSNLEHLSSMMMSLRSNSCSSVKAMAKAGALSAPTTPARVDFRNWGLQLAWDKGYNEVIVESDSKVGLELIEDEVLTSPYHNLVKQIRNMKSRDWSCKLQHIWREGNRCADWLAKEAIRLQSSGGRLEEPPEGLRELLGADIIGVTTPRLIPC